jgi:hypothetical protein
LGFLFLVPVPHAARTSYVVLVADPSNSSTPSCEGAVFYQTGIYSFTWYVPNGNPTFLTVNSSTGGTVYHGLTNGGQAGSFAVDSSDSPYEFCLNIEASAPTLPGPQSVVAVSGDLSYSYTAPTL